MTGVSSVDNRNNGNVGLITAGSAIVGGGAGALAGYYSKPWVKDDAPTDTFIKKAGERVVNASDIPDAQKEVFKNASSMIDKMKNAKTVEEFKNATLEPINKVIDSYSDINALKANYRNGLDMVDNLTFNNINFDVYEQKFANATSIDEYKKVLSEAVEAGINAKGLDKCKQDFANSIDVIRKSGIPVTMDDLVNQIFNELYDKDAKKFVKNKDYTENTFNIVNDVAKKMQGKAAIIWGSIGAAALGIGGFAVAKAMNHKNSAQPQEKNVDTTA